MDDNQMGSFITQNGNNKNEVGLYNYFLKDNKNVKVKKM